MVYIKIKSPNGGESWTIGSSQNIDWVTDIPFGCADCIGIQLLKGGTVVKTWDWAYNDGNKPWVVDSSLTPGSDYKIKVWSRGYPNVSDTSDGNFTITGTSQVKYSCNQTTSTCFEDVQGTFDNLVVCNTACSDGGGNGFDYRKYLDIKYLPYATLIIVGIYFLTKD